MTLTELVEFLQQLTVSLSRKPLFTLRLSGFTYDGENDTNGNPIGLDYSFATWNAGGSGNLKITLRHQPDKNAAGVSSGDIANANGETDIEVEFPVRLY